MLKRNPFEICEVTSFWPPHVTPRITVQAGCFTAHPEPDDSGEYPWKGVRERILIPGSCRSGLRADLLKLGVTRVRLFPDLDGLSDTLAYWLSRPDP